MRHPFRRLLGKELRQSATATLPTAGVFALFYLLLNYVRWHYLGGDPEAWQLTGYALMPFFALPFLTIWRALAKWKAEWTGKHVHLLFMLPVPGWWLVLAKTLALMLEAAVLFIVTLAGVLALLWDGHIARTLVWLLHLATGRDTLVLLILIGLLFSMTVVVQFAALAGRLVSRLSGWFSALMMLTTGWAFIRFSGLAASLFRWVPPLPSARCIPQGEFDGCSWLWLHYHVPALIAALIGATLLVWFSSWLIERHLEA